MREYKEIYNDEEYKMRSQVTKRKLERRAGGLEGLGFRQSADNPRFSCVSLISTRGVHKLQAPTSGHENSGKLEIPIRVV